MRRRVNSQYCMNMQRLVEKSLDCVCTLVLKSCDSCMMFGCDLLDCFLLMSSILS